MLCSFAFRFLERFHAFFLSQTSPGESEAEAPVRDKEFGSLRGARMTWVPRNVERERNTHWAGWRQSGEAGWRAAGRATVHLVNGGPG